MSDSFTVEYTPGAGGQFAPMPEGPQIVVCVDGVYLGHKLEQFQNEPPKLVQKYAFVFQSEDVDPETDRRYEVSKEFTISMHEKAGLRKFLAGWRGKSYSDEDAKKVDLHKVEGACGIGTIEHRVSAKGRTYAVLSNISPLMRGMAKIAPAEYERGAYWQTRKDEYKAAVDAHIQKTAPAAKAAPALPLDATTATRQETADALAQVRQERQAQDAAAVAAAIDDGLPF